MNGTFAVANRLPAFIAAQMAWAVCSALWNLVGSIRLSRGLIGLGPTASLPAAPRARRPRGDAAVHLAEMAGCIRRALRGAVALGATVTVYGPPRRRAPTSGPRTFGDWGARR